MATLATTLRVLFQDDLTYEIAEETFADELLEEEEELRQSKVEDFSQTEIDTLTAVGYAIAARRANRESKVFDWDYAATMLRMFASDGITDVEVCILEDRGHTCEYAIENKRINPDSGCAFLASIWGTPGMIVYYEDGSEVTIPCFKMASEVPDWNEDTWWPDSAVNILKGKKEVSY